MADIGTVLIKISSDITELKQGLSNAQKELTKLKANTKKESNEFQKIFLGMFSAHAAYDFAKKAAEAIKEFVIESIKTFAEFETKQKSFFQILGSSAEITLSEMQDAAKGTASSLDLITSANKALMLGIDQNNLPILLEKSRILGLAMGRTTTEAFEDISIGIGRQSRLILDNLGLIVRAEDAYKVYASIIGKTTDQLDENEKRMAFQQATIAQLILKTAGLGDQTDTLNYQMQRLSTQVTELKINIGEELSPTIKGVNKIIADELLLLNTWIDRQQEKIKLIREENEERKEQIMQGDSYAGSVMRQNKAYYEYIQTQKEGRIIDAEEYQSGKALIDAAEKRRIADENLRQEEILLTGEGKKYVEQLQAAYIEYAKNKDVNKYTEAVHELVEEAKKLGVTESISTKIFMENMVALGESSEATKRRAEAETDLQRGIEHTQRIIKEYDNQIKQQTATLREYETSLGKIKDSIRSLESPVFEGQRAQEEEIWQLEMLIKQREYEGESVDDLKEKLDKLRLAYEIKYETMRHEIEKHVQEHEDAKNQIFDSVQQVIEQLDKNWEAETKVTSAIESQKNMIEQTKNAREDYIEQLDRLRDRLKDVADEAERATKAMSSVGTGGAGIPSSWTAGGAGGGIPAGGAWTSYTPALQHGGIVTRPTLAMIGERGPEAVIPLNKAGGIGTQNVTVYIDARSADGREIASKLGDYLNTKIVYGGM